MLEIYFKTISDPQFKRIDDYRPGCWVYIKEANLEDLGQICKMANLDLNDIRESLDKYEQPRLENVDENIFFFIRSPATSEFGLYTEPLTLVLTKTSIITICPFSSAIIESIMNSPTTPSTTQKSKLILHILLKITQEYTNSIKRVRHTIVGAESPTEIVDSSSIITLTKSEEILNQYLTSLVPMRNLLETLATGRHMHFYESDLDLLEDLMIAMRQSEDVCRVNVKSIRSLRDSYHIIFTNDVNKTIKLLTAVTIIFTIPTIVASIYGMNVALPYQKKPHAFLIVMGITLIFCIITTILFRKNRWL